MLKAIMQDEFYREIGKPRCKEHAPEERDVGSSLVIQHPQLVSFMILPQTQPLIELVSGNLVSFAELFDRKVAGKILTQKAKDKEQTEAGIRDDNFQKNRMGMFTAVAEESHGHVYSSCRRLLLHKD